MDQHTTADLYLRLSPDREGKTAIDRQEADCRAWAERNGLTVRKVHIDRGRSGYKNVSRKVSTRRSQQPRPASWAS